MHGYVRPFAIGLVLAVPMSGAPGTAVADGTAAAVIVAVTGANAALMGDAPRTMPCGYSGVPDDRCPGVRADLESPTCKVILDRLGKADAADWHRRRDLVENAKRTGCAPYQR
jgi:hypothetical protein